MRKLFYLSAISFFCLNFVACNQEVDLFDNGENYVYFNLPYAVTESGKETTKHVDSLEYSFALAAPEDRTYIFKIAVNTIGLANDADRPYKVEVVQEATSAAIEDWDPSSIASPVIHAGRLSDTLYIKVYRREILKEQSRNITLRLLPNENFQLGNNAGLTAKISFSDIVTAPAWWEAWIKYFGPFSREKFVKWQEIYYEGADPNKDDKSATCKGEGVLYWNNMPCSVRWVESRTPSTLMFIQILKQYFIDNEVYPDGDTSKPRIQLP